MSGDIRKIHEEAHLRAMVRVNGETVSKYERADLTNLLIRVLDAQDRILERLETIGSQRAMSPELAQSIATTFAQQAAKISDLGRKVEDMRKALM